MNTQEILPVLDVTVLKEKATEYAMKGATESIKDHYSGYNSPFRKAIDEDLKTKGLSFTLDLPDIIAVLNESLTKEIDQIANEAIAKTFVPMVRRFLTRENAEVSFSDILRKFIEAVRPEHPEDCECEVEKDESYGWLKVILSSKGVRYSLTLHEHYESKKAGLSRYQLLSLPYDDSRHQEKMKLSIDGATLEMPFTKDILQDEFKSYVARVVLSKSIITMDCTDFDDDMFPNDCYCH